MQAGDVVAERFVVERVSASGGMGRVYRARDRLSSTTVALKVLHGAGVHETERFEREAQVLATLRDPGIVRYVAYGTTSEGEPYLVMEWLDGETLLERLKRDGLTLFETLTLGERAAAALGAVHRRGIVHRDLKPSNLFLPDRSVERVMLIDFGIARLTEEGQQLTVPGAMLGTPGYVAPEQARGEAGVDARADVFSLGCVLFRCLTGRGAFLGDDALSILLKVAVEEPPTVRELRAEMPDALSDLVARMLAKSPADRPLDGGAVAAELRALIAGGPAAIDAPGSERPHEITTTERRVMCLVLARPPWLCASDAGPQVEEPRLVYGERSRVERALDAAMAAQDARLESLADGMRFVVLTSEGTATDLATRAARCALSIRALQPGARLSIVSGRGVLSSRLPVGELIDRAVRLLGADAEADEIRVDEVIGGLLDVRFDIEGEVPALRLRGERDELDAKRMLLGRPTTCVGREHELGLLEATFAQCLDERVARVVLVTAPAGFGKSRLRHELLRRLRDRGRSAEILFGHGDSMSAGSAFGMIARALRRASGIFDGEPLEARQEKLRVRVARHVTSDVNRVTELLGEIMGVPFPDQESPNLRAARRDPMRMGEQVRRAWEDFLLAETSAHPVLLVLEDLQWGDRPTIKLVESALRRLEEQPLMVLALGRPEVGDLFPNLWTGRDLQAIQLGELTRRASERLVRQVLGEEVSAETVRAIVERADGHAFYLEELIRSVAEGKGAVMPETVLAMVEARLERLDGELRRALRAASVFGETFWEGGVTALLGGASAGAWIQELEEQEILSRSWDGRFPDQPEYRFRHALVREAAYRMLTEGDRALGHRLAGEWLERMGESNAIALAEHFDRGREPERAASWYRRAAEQALRGGDAEAAVERAERGLAELPSGEHRAGLVTLLGAAHSWRHDFARADPYLDEALRITAPGSGRWCTAMMSKLVGAIARGKIESLVEVVTGLGRVEPTPDGAGAFLAAIALVYEMISYVAQRELAEVYFARVEKVGRPLEDDPAARAWLEYSRANRARWGVDPWTAVKLMTRAAASFDEAGSPGYAAMTRVREGYCNIAIGAHAEAERVLRGVLARGDGGGFQSTMAELYLAMSLSERGAHEEAQAVLAELREALLARKTHGLLGLVRWISAVVHRRLGDLVVAEREVLAALDLLVVSPFDLLWAEATLADVRLAQGRTSEALAIAEKAAKRRQEMAFPHLMDPHLTLVHAQVLAAAGDTGGAWEVIAAGRDDVLARAARIEDVEARRTFVEAVPAHARTLALAREWLG